VKAARSRTFLDLLVVLAIVLVTWEILGRSGVLGARAFPPVSKVLVGIPYVLTSGTTRFWHHLSVTLSEVIRGYAIAVVVGSASGVAVALLPRVGRATLPIFVAWEVIPKVALVPLLIVALGYGQASEVAIAAMMGFFAIFLNTYRGLARADERAVQLMRSIGATRYQQFRYYLFPQSLPTVFAGLKIGLSFAFLGAILGELLTLQEGVGFTINAYRGQLRMDLAYAATILVALVGTGLLFVIELLERRAIPWFESEDRATEVAALG
jgi:ABC-type nitrate/sulfonate/bicarbonate transport system permease component